MRLPKFRVALALIVSPLLFLTPALADITVGHVDDFQDGTTQHWRIGQVSSFPKNLANSGPLGTGDHALFMTNTQAGSRPLLIVLNEDNQQFPGPANWEGDWTAAGVTQISLDVRNPGMTVGASNLTMRLGIAGPDGASAFGDVYITAGQIVPPDNNWHSLTFDVQASDFIAAGSGTDIPNALADVTQLRIFSNPLDEFPGSGAPNEFYLDNIRVIGAPATVPGDYNKNGTVDAADYAVWRDTLGQNVTPGMGADGSGPVGAPDGVINAYDYDFWRSRFGKTAPASASSIASTAVPEPASWIVFAVVFVAAGRRIGR
jgi:hypothetical protein